VCADVAAEGKNCGEVYLEDLSFQPSAPSLPPSLYRIGGMAHLVPVIIRKLRRGVPSLNTSTVYEDIDLMPIFQDCRSEARDFGLRGKVCGVDGCFAAQCFYGF
jgi:hypothetical protein